MTMHDMIESISVGGNSSRQKKLLFLTGEQADQIAQTSNALEAMLRAFDVGSKSARGYPNRDLVGLLCRAPSPA